MSEREVGWDGEVDPKTWESPVSTVVRRVPTNVVVFHREVGGGDLGEGGRKFRISIGMDGGIWVAFEPGPDEVTVSKDRFVVRIEDVLEAVSELVSKDGK